MASVLVIDDDTSHRALVERSADCLRLAVEWGQVPFVDANQIDRLRPGSAILLGNASSDAAWAELVERLARHHAKVPVIAIAAHPAAAIEATRAGACEVLFKPLSEEELHGALSRASARSQAPAALAVRDTALLNGASADLLVGRSPAMRRLCQAIGLAAACDVPVLVVGEAGVGKRTIARAIHDYSHDRQQALSVIECGGHTYFDEPAAVMSDADRAAKRRRSSSASSLPESGVCLLHGVEQLAPSAQWQLLRYLRKWQQVGPGDNASDAGAARVIATADYDAGAAASSRLLDALYYELGRFVIAAPALRERLEDLPLLAEHFLRTWSRRLGKRVFQLSPAAMELLQAHPWPGNLRELSSVICQGVICCKGTMLATDDVAERVQITATPTNMADDEAIMDWRRFVDEKLATEAEGLYHAAVEATDQRLLKLVLERMEGNQARAAKALGMTRGRLRQKLRERGIVIDRQIDVHHCL